MTWGELLFSRILLQSPALPTELSRVMSYLECYMNKMHSSFSYELRLLFWFTSYIQCIIFFYISLRCLRRGRRRLLYLEVVAVEVALEVEVRERVLRSDTEESLELRVRLDRVLVLEVLLLDVRRDGLRYV